MNLFDINSEEDLKDFCLEQYKNKKAFNSVRTKNRVLLALNRLSYDVWDRLMLYVETRQEYFKRENSDSQEDSTIRRLLGELDFLLHQEIMDEYVTSTDEENTLTEVFNAILDEDISHGETK